MDWPAPTNPNRRRRPRSAAAAILTGTGHEGQAYELSGPAALGYGDQMRIVAEVTGKPYSFVAVPDEDWRRTALSLGFPPYLVDALVDLQRFQRLGLCTQTTPWVTQLTGSPPTTFRRFVEDHAEAFR